MKDGITFEILDGHALLEDTQANETTHNRHRVRLDVVAYKRMIEEALREQAKLLIESDNLNDKVRASLNRMIESSTNSLHGKIEKLVVDEVERLIRQRVVELVRQLPIVVNVNIDGKVTNTEDGK